MCNGSVIFLLMVIFKSKYVQSGDKIMLISKLVIVIDCRMKFEGDECKFFSGFFYIVKIINVFLKVIRGDIVYKMIFCIQVKRIIRFC